MARRVRLTWLPLSQLATVSVCVCTFALLPFSQLATLTLAKSAGAERHCHEDGASSKELVVLSSARRHLKDQRRRAPARPHEVSDRLHQTVTVSYAGHILGIIGHQLANGLCAPLLL